MRRSLFDMGCKRDVSLEEFFDARYRVDEKGCWIWTGKINKAVSGGYGEIRRKRGTPTYKAHRVSFEMHKGPIPDDMCVCHTCDVRACVNPDHLFLGTKADNNADMHKKERNGVNPLKGEESTSAKLTENQVLAIIRDERAQTKIAKDYGVSHGLIGEIKRKEKWKHVWDKHGLEWTPPNKHYASLSGVANPKSKLTESDVLKIKEDPRSQAKIAKDYGIAQQTVQGIKSGKRWKHLTK